MEDKHGLWLVSIVAIVAVVALVVLITGRGSSGVASSVGSGEDETGRAMMIYDDEVASNSASYSYGPYSITSTNTVSIISTLPASKVLAYCCTKANGGGSAGQCATKGEYGYTSCDDAVDNCGSGGKMGFGDKSATCPK